MPRVKKGNFVSSYNFDGTASRVQFAAAGTALLIPTPFVTVCAWIKTPGPATPGTAMVILARDNASTGTIFNLSVGTTGTITYKVRSNTPATSTATGAKVVTDGRWHFVMGSWDGTTINVFVDGALDGTQSFSGTLNQNNTAYPALGIMTGTSNWYKGLICAAAVYNIGFTLAMHKEIYYKNEEYSQYRVYKQDCRRDLLVANTTVAMDYDNLFNSNTICTITLSTEVPPTDDRHVLPITKTTVSASAKGATIFNTASYADSYLTTFNGNQYIVFQNSALHIMMGKRATGSSSWTIVDTGIITGTDDDHNLATIGIDANGYIHLTYDHHGTALKYKKSNNPEDITAFTTASMTGQNESQISYPKWFNANGYLFFAYRYGGSTSGDEYLKRYNPSGGTWTDLGKLVDGANYSYGTYPDSYAVDANGRIHHCWCYRTVTIGYAYFTYMYSDDNGATWKNSAGTTYSLPITPSTAGDIFGGPALTDLFWPQNHLAIDSNNRPHIAYAKAPARISRDNYWHAYLDNGTWTHVQLSDFSNTISSLVTFGNYKHSRPTTFLDKTTDRVYVLGRSWKDNYLRLFTAPAPWTNFEHYRLGIPPENYGVMEMGGLDKVLFNATGKLNITADQTSSANPTTLYVLECDLRTYFANATGRTAVSGRIPSSYFTYASVNLNGTSGNASVPYNAMSALIGNYSVSAWIYARTLGEGNAGYIMGKGAGAINLYLNSGGGLTLEHVSSAISSDSNLVDLNTWTHVAAVYSSSAGGTVTFYKNGAVFGAVKVQGTNNNGSNTSAMSIGQLQGADTNTFDGYIFLPTLSAGALTADQVLRSKQFRTLIDSDLLAAAKFLGYAVDASVYKDYVTGTAGTYTTATYSATCPQLAPRTAIT